MTTLPELFALARRCHQARDFRRAEKLYQQILATDAGNAPVWCYLGMVLQMQGKHNEAVDCFKQALALKPNLAEAHTQLGVTHADQGRFEQAAACYQQALRCNADDLETLFHLGNAQAALGRLGHAVQTFQQMLRLKPDHVDAHTCLGITLARQGNTDEAIASLQQAIQLRPDYAKAHNNLGVALAEKGKTEEALAAWREAVRLRPDYAEAHFNIAVTLNERRQPDEAIAAYQRAIQLKPDYAEALNNLGLTLTEQGRHHEAIAVIQQALRLKPHYPEAHNNLGLALVELGRYPEMIESFQTALRLNPAYPEAHNNFGTAMAAMGRPEDAQAIYQVALWLRPDYAEVHWNRSLAWLQTGEYEKGWREYEWRWKRKRATPRNFSQPQWDGAPLHGRTILLWTEQGRGDTIQFVRYAALVKRYGGTVVLEAPADLIPLLAGCPGIDRIVAEGTDLPPFDVQASLMSLPGILGTTLRTVPAEIPYLVIPPEVLERWRGAVGDEPGLKVGITWQGNPRHKWDRHRSFPLTRFAPLARIPGVRLYSLQRGPGHEQLEALRGAFPVTYLGGLPDGDTDPFLKTAALMKHLDLLILCDSAPAHVAGALGLPVWLPLSFLVDWRWMHQREDTPWYPSIRLFRQQQLGDWDPVFRRITDDLAALAAGRHGQTTAGLAPPFPARPAHEYVDFGPEEKAIIEAVAPYTMTSRERVFTLIQAIDYLARAGIEGEIVECGVWRGGSMMAAALTLLRFRHPLRRLHLFDTFEGMSPPAEDDRDFQGISAAEQLARADRQRSLSWAVASLPEVQRNLARTGYPAELIRYVPGRVETTLPAEAPEKIALLRLDTDWQASTRHELEHLFPRLQRGGVLLIDDYGHWRGARQAVDDYFRSHNIPILLCRIDYTGRIAVKP